MTPDQWSRVFSAVADAALKADDLSASPYVKLRYLLNVAAIECDAMASDRTRGSLVSHRTDTE